jgi:hypothetical protein
MKAVGEDFAELFACVWATMERELPYKIEDEKGTIIKKCIKGSSQAGNYTVYYAEDGRLEVLFDSTDPDDRYDVKFVPIGGS